MANHMISLLTSSTTDPWIKPLLVPCILFRAKRNVHGQRGRHQIEIKPKCLFQNVLRFCM
jgi:hypothetical protein